MSQIPPHLSYYEVLVRNTQAYKLAEQGKLPRLLEEIKSSSSEESGVGDSNRSFTAQELRDALPNLLRKSDSVLKQYENGKIPFKEAASRAEISESKQNVERATAFLSDISKKDLDLLSANNFNAFGQALKKLKRAYDLVENMVKNVKSH